MASAGAGGREQLEHGDTLGHLSFTDNVAEEPVEVSIDVSVDEPALAADLTEPVTAAVSAVDFRLEGPQSLGWSSWSPGGDHARVAANVAALQVLTDVEEQQRPATPGEQQVLARWTSWGAVPRVFEQPVPGEGDARPEHLQAAGRVLQETLSPQEYAAARRTTINAHFTDPEYARAMWDALAALGFQGGQVLEPGCGVGSFLGTAPAGAVMTGVELDPTTARIARLLYPSATVRAESFAHSPWADGTFDAVIGNVPFGDVRLHDPNHNPDNYSLHNHFLLKSLALTRPGGIVIALTSRFTLDSVVDDARENMAQMADLVGAVRLPTNAHRSLAGTAAVTDLLVFRRRFDHEPPGDGSWLLTTETDAVDQDGNLVEVDVNAWFVEHPEMVLGDLRVGHGMYGSATLNVVTGDLGGVPGQLQAALGQVVQYATTAGLTTSPALNSAARIDPAAVAEPVASAGDVARFDGHLSWDPEQGWRRQTGGRLEPEQVPASQEAQLRGLLRLRDAGVAVLTAEAATGEDTDDLAGLRKALNTAYDTYVGRWGPINKVTITATARLDKNGDPIVTRRYPAAVRTFRDDPHSPLVRALENYDEGTGVASKAAIFSRRVVAPRVARTSADSPADAVAIVMDAVGEVRLDDVTRLLSLTPEQAREALGTLVFDDPTQPGRLVPAAEYLSGNVRRALEVAQDAAQERPELAVNVTALREVLPADLGPDDIVVRLGAVWVPDEDMTAFVQETLGDPRASVTHSGGSNWEVSGAKHTVAATSTWGTQRADAIGLLESLMQQRQIKVTDTIDDDGSKRQVLNLVETEAAQAKATALQDRFSAWLWEDPQRSDRLCRIYNDTFNSLVLRSYDTEGERLSLPGLVQGWHPHPHQRTAVARMIAEPSVGLYHEVGAGKTAEMVMGSMELKRLGLVNKPAVVVPNHMLEQFTREALQLYPQANVLAAASEDLRGDGRRRFIARAATGDWDMVVMTQGAFGSIPVTADAERAYIDAQTDTLRAAIAKCEDPRSRTVKKMEKKIIAMEEKLTSKLNGRRDPGLCWEHTGIDYLLVDELHMYKNLTIASNIQGLGKDGSVRASDLDMKIELLRANAGGRGRVMTGATATPIANSMAEAWVMQRYLRPDLLLDAGITDFDSWAATFGTVVSEWEAGPAGGYRLKERFAQFQNVPELLRMWHVSGDIKTAEDLALPGVPVQRQRPDGQRLPETVVVPATPAHRQFMQSLDGRVSAIQAKAVDPTEDNMLKVTSDGRKASLDLRLYDPDSGSDLLLDVTKVDVAADRIHRIWTETKDNRYVIDPRADHPEPHPTPGGFQIVFCDLGTPNADRWNVYDQLRDNLTARGMDRSRIRFIHDANNDAKKGQLFQACRSGEVDVLIGSTEKMGVGTNIQNRAVALHHMDCPWRPADVQQREGRILRQGNQNQQVQIFRYVTQDTLDTYSWQTVERKAKFIEQVMHGNLESRELEDVFAGGQSMSAAQYAESKAASSSNPLLLERLKVTTDIGRLNRLQIAHTRAEQHSARSIGVFTSRIESLHHQIPALEAAIAARVSTRGEAFTATIGDHPYSDRVVAAEALRQQLKGPLFRLNLIGDQTGSMPGVVRMGGHVFDADLEARPSMDGTITRAATLSVAGVPSKSVVISDDEIRTGTEHGPITRLENLLAGLDAQLSAAENELRTTQSELAQAQQDAGQPFPHTQELHDLQQRLDDIDQQLSHAADHPDTDTTVPGQVPVSGPVQDSHTEVSTDEQGAINTAGIAKIRATLAAIQSQRTGTQHQVPAEWAGPAHQRATPPEPRQSPDRWNHPHTHDDPSQRTGPHL